MNRFSKDVGSMDELLPKIFMESLQLLFITVGALLIVVLVNNSMILAVIGLVVAVYFIRILFLKTINPLKRIEGVSK